MDKFISVILPTYNEKENIIALLQAIHCQLESRPHEIIVIDDQSPDGTYQAVCDLCDKRVKAILRTANPGLARSIARGLKEASGNIVLVMDSDFDHDPKYIPFMVNAIAQYDCVCASRFLPGGKMNGCLHSLGSRVFNLFIRLTTASSLTDHLYGYFLIKREALEQCPLEKIFFGYGDYYIRLLYYLEKNNIPIFQFPAINGGRVRPKKAGFVKIFWQYVIAVVRLPQISPMKSHV